MASAQLPEGTTSEQANPQPIAWPQCAVCHVDYVLRRALFMSGTARWCWMRDCARPRSTCTGAAAVIMGPDGPLPMADNDG